MATTTHISKRSRLNFVEFAAEGVLSDIRRVFESEDFEPAAPESVQEQGERRTLAARYHAGLDPEDEATAQKLGRVYVDAIAAWGRSGGGDLSDAARALINSLQKDGLPIDDDGNPVADTARRQSAARRRAEPGDRLFVSHAAVDIDLAEALIELLRLGTDLRSSDIFLSSLPETGVPPGHDFINHIREELAGAALILQLITPAFFESAFCLCELGAQWGMELPGFPLLVPPIDYADLQGVLGNVQAAKIDEPTALDGLYDRVRAEFGLDPPTAGWTKQRQRFLNRLDELLAELAEPQKVERRLYEQTMAELRATGEDRDRARAEADNLVRKVQDLSKLKDADEVAEILADEDNRKGL